MQDVVQLFLDSAGVFNYLDFHLFRLSEDDFRDKESHKKMQNMFP